MAVEAPWADTVLALALLVVVCLESRIDGRFPPPVWLWVLTSVITTLSLAWRRRYPFAVLIAGSVAILVQAYGSSVPQSAALFVCSLLATYTVAAHSGRAARWWTITVLLAVLPLYLLRDPATKNVAEALPTYLIQAGSYAMGTVVRVRAGRAAAAERAAEVTTLQVTTAAAAERLRIAHELHDVVAHGLSLMLIQASAARVAWERGDPVAGDRMRAVEETGRAALREMRWLLGVLRTDESAELAPTPRLDDLPDLVDSLRRSGLRLDLDVDAGPLDAAMELSLYRITQEALTNVVKHAGATSARVAVTRQGRHVVLRVEDNGNSEPAAAITADRGGAGHVGMRERAAAFGGTVAAGPLVGGGYAVTATLPLEPAQ